MGTTERASAPHTHWTLSGNRGVCVCVCVCVCVWHMVYVVCGVMYIYIYIYMGGVMGFVRDM